MKWKKIKFLIFLQAQLNVCGISFFILQRFVVHVLKKIIEVKEQKRFKYQQHVICFGNIACEIEGLGT